MLLLAWPVVSINEWSVQQRRVLVLTSMFLYRMAYEPSSGSVDHYSRVSLGAMRRAERGAAAFRLVRARALVVVVVVSLLTVLLLLLTPRAAPLPCVWQVLTQPDGRENPFTYFWSEFIAHAAANDAGRYEKVYYPLVPVEVVFFTYFAAISCSSTSIICVQR